MSNTILRSNTPKSPVCGSGFDSMEGSDEEDMMNEEDEQPFDYDEPEQGLVLADELLRKVCRYVKILRNF